MYQMQCTPSLNKRKLLGIILLGEYTKQTVANDVANNLKINREKVGSYD